MEYVLADETSGVAVTLEPSVPDRLVLAQPGGLDGQAIHVTLGVATGDPNEIVAALLTAVLPVAATAPAIVGTIDGVAVLAAGTAAMFAAEGATELAVAVSEAITAAGLTPAAGGFLPMALLATTGDAVDPSLIGTAITFDNIGIRFAGQTLLIPFAAAAPAPTVEEIAPEEAPAAEVEVPAEDPTATTAVEGAATAAITPDDEGLIEGAPVSWIDPTTGEARTGTIAMLTGLADDPPTITIAPDDAPDVPVVAPLSDLTLGSVPEEALPAPEGDEAPIEEGPGEVAEYEPTYDVVEDHPDCTGPEGTVGVVVFLSAEDTGTLNSCWLDTDAAQAAIEALIADRADEADDDDEGDLVSFDADAVAPEAEAATTETEQASVTTGMAELLRAAELAAKVSGTLAELRGLDPTAPAATASLAPLELRGPADEAPRLVTTSGDTFTTETTTVYTDGANAPVLDNAADDEAVQAAAAELLAAAAEVQEAADQVDTAAADVAAAEADVVEEAERLLADASRDELVAALAGKLVEETAAELGIPADDVTVDGIDIAVSADATDDGTPAAEDGAVELGDAAAELAPDDDQAVAVDEGTSVGAPMADTFSDKVYDWEGVLIVEGLPSGDGRMIAPGALGTRELPVPLMLQTVNAQGHDGSVICGSIHECVRSGEKIMGRGMFDSGAAGTEAARLLGEGTMRGVSADIDSVVVEFLDDQGNPAAFEDVMEGLVDAVECLVQGRIMGATLTPFPAFQEAHVQIIAQAVADEALVASGAQGDVWRTFNATGVWKPGFAPEQALVASAGVVVQASDIVDVPVAPPLEWFTEQAMETPVPFGIGADGRVFGLVAQFGSCHIGFGNRCVDVPKSKSNYSHFRNKMTLTAEGIQVATGPIFMDTVHPQLRLKASDAQAHYAKTGCAFADVILYENEWGIVAAGALRTGLTYAQVREARGSDVSPDWRSIKRNLEVVGLLSVNVSGFIVEGLVASGGIPSAPTSLARGRYDSVADEVTALVAAGMVHQGNVERSLSAARVQELTEQVEAMALVLDDLVNGPARREAAAAAAARFGLGSVEENRAARAEALMSRFDTAPHASAVASVMARFATAECGGSCGGDEGSCACTH